MSSYKALGTAMVATALILTGCGSDDSKSTADIDPILTELNFNYGYANSATRFTRNVSFSSSDVVFDGDEAYIEKVSDTTGWFCTSISDNFEYVCIYGYGITRNAMEMDLFTFALSANHENGSGTFEQCETVSSDASMDACASKLLSNSDGDVTVTLGTPTANLQSDFAGNGSVTIDADNDPDASHYLTVDEQATQYQDQSSQSVNVARAASISNAISLAVSKIK